MGKNTGLNYRDVEEIVHTMLCGHGTPLAELQGKINYLLEMNTVNKRIFNVILSKLDKIICPQCNGKTSIGLVDCLMCGKTGVVDLKEPEDDKG